MTEEEIVIKFGADVEEAERAAILRYLRKCYKMAYGHDIVQDTIGACIEDIESLEHHRESK